MELNNPLLKKDMERHLRLADVEATVKAAYEKVKDIDTDGGADPRLKDVDASKFGIVVMLTDGRTVKVGDTDVKSPMGALANIPLYAVHRQQKLAEAGTGEKKCCCCKKSQDEGEKPANLPISPRGIRLVSKIQPRGDKDGKYGVIEDMVVGMMGSAPELNDALYESMTETNLAANVENEIAAAEYVLYDDAPASIDIYTKLSALQATPEQLAVMGATVAADGRNPLSGEYAFDGEIAPRVVAYMAARGPHHMSKKWLIKTGLPAKSSFGGAIVGVYPGVMSIVAYSPELNDRGVSAKAAKAIHHIMKSLDINVFDSSKLVID